MKMRISELDPEEVDIPGLLTTTRSIQNEGCLNEPMRIFSDVGWNEDVVNQLVGVDSVGTVVPPHMADFAVKQTVERMSQCVVGILERPEDTLKALQHYLPWLAEYVHLDQKHNGGMVHKGNLTQATIQSIEHVSRYERQVYDAANKLLDEQIRGIA